MTKILAKLRFLGKMCIELMGIKNHIIINPNYIIPPHKGIDTIFLTHGHQKNCYLNCLNEIKENYASRDKELKIFGPKSVAEIHDIDIEGIKEKQNIKLPNIVVYPYKLTCENAIECFAYLIVIEEEVIILHTANATKFSDRIKNFNDKIDYCFISCEKENYGEYLDFLRDLFPKVTFPYNFKPGEEDKAKEFINYLRKANLEVDYIEIGTEFEF